MPKTLPNPAECNLDAYLWVCAVYPRVIYSMPSSVGVIYPARLSLACHMFAKETEKKTIVTRSLDCYIPACLWLTGPTVLSLRYTCTPLSRWSEGHVPTSQWTNFVYPFAWWIRDEGRTSFVFLNPSYLLEIRAHFDAIFLIIEAVAPDIFWCVKLATTLVLHYTFCNSQF